MHKLQFILTAAFCSLALMSRGQVTNVPPTELETFEAQTGTVIVKGASQIGSLAVGALNITVISKETLDVSTGRKEYGMAIELAENNRQVWKRVVDYDEFDTFISGLDYLARIDYPVTTLPTFTASYTTKSGFRVGAFTSQRHSAILFFLQDCSINGERIIISSAQLAQFQTLVEQTRKNLDLLRIPR